MILLKFIRDAILNLLYPCLCESCNNVLFKGEKLICTKCIYNIPRTNFHLSTDNKINMIFWARIDIKNACSFFYYNKASNYQLLIHSFKYRRRKDIGFRLSNLFALDLMNSKWISDIDFIIPVPLHIRKELIRGYNQSLIISMGISEITEIPVCADVIFRNTNSTTQTNKSRFERWENVDNIFSVKNIDQLSGKHVLIVDDVVTTGSTLESCAQALRKADSSILISIATLATS